MSIILVLVTIFSTFGVMTVLAEEELMRPEITGIRASGNIVSLEWYDMNDDFTSFYVYRSTTGKAGSWTKIASTKEMEYVDDTAIPNSTYYYTVKTALKVGKKTIVSASCPKEKVSTDFDKPVFSAVSNHGNGVYLKWDQRDDISGVIIYKSLTGKAGSWSKIKTVKSAKGGTYIDSDVEIGKTYYYCIKVYKTVNGKNYYSSPSKAYKKTVSDVEVPTGLYVNPVFEGMEISFNKVPGTKGYVIYKSTSGKKGTWKKICTTTSNNTTKYLDKDVVNGVEYYYTVKSYKVLKSGTVYSSPADAYCEMATKGDMHITPSSIDVQFNSLLESQTIKIVVDGEPKYDSLKVKVDEEGQSVVGAKWGKKTGNVSELILTRLGPGEAVVTVYYENYPEVYADIYVTAEQLELDTDYMKVQELMKDAYDLFKEALELFQLSQQEGISDIDKAKYLKEATDKIAEASVILEEALELAEKYAEYSEDDELIQSLLKVAKIIGDFVNVDNIDSSTVKLIMGYLNKILAAIKK